MSKNKVIKRAKADFLDAREVGHAYLIESIREVEYDDFTEADKELYMKTYNELINN